MVCVARSRLPALALVVAAFALVVDSEKLVILTDTGISEAAVLKTNVCSLDDLSGDPAPLEVTELPAAVQQRFVRLECQRPSIHRLPSPNQTGPSLRSRRRRAAFPARTALVHGG